MAILSIGFGKSMIFTFFAMAKEETPSSKTCMISISPLKNTKDRKKVSVTTPNDPTSVTTPPHMFQPVIETYVA